MKRRAALEITPKSTSKKKAVNPLSRSMLIQDRGVKGEIKVTDATINVDPAFGSAAFTTPTLVNALAIGGDYNNRVGRKVVFTKLMVRWLVSQQSSTGGANFRILVVYDKQANGVAPSMTDILSSNDFSSFNNLNNRDRFITIIDHITESVSQGGNASGAGVITRKIALETIFNADPTAVIGAINTGAIFLMVAQSGGDITTSPDFHCRVRLRFNDA